MRKVHTQKRYERLKTTSLPDTGEPWVVHGCEPFMLRKALPILPNDAFIHPLEREAKAGGKTTKVIFNIHNLPLIINIWVDANKLIPPFHMLYVCHKTSLLSSVPLVVSINSPLSFSLLLIISGLFLLVYTGSEAWKALRRKSWPFAYPLTLTRGRVQCIGNRGRLRE